MGLKAGHKLTELGVLPTDWEVVPMKSLGSFLKGQGIRKDEAVSGTLPAVRYGEIYTHHDEVIKSFNSWISPEVARRSVRLSKGDILFAGSGETKEEIGKCVAFVVDIEAYAGGDVVILRPREGDSTFFGYLFNAPIVARQKASKGQGDAIVHINSRSLSAIKIPLPPTLTEQRAIAEALSDADALIESLESLIAKKRLIKQGAMQELLTGKKRLPGFEDEWVVKRLGECLLANPDYGINAPGVPSSRDLPAYIRITDIDDDGRFIPTGRVAVDHPLAMNYRLSENEFLFARTGASVGKTYLYTSEDGEVVFAGFLIRAKIDTTKLNPKFLSAYTRTQKYWNWVRVMSMRSGQPGINGNEYASLLLRMPPTVEEQTAIGQILSDMDAEIAALESRLAKARNIKQGMMQELLTGRVRLVKPKEAV